MKIKQQSSRLHRQIAAIHKAICRELFTVNGKFPYSKLSSLFRILADRIHEYNDDSESLWYIGEFIESSLSDMIVGAYWHYSEWYSGQWSDEYATMCALGKVFNAGCTSAPKRGDSKFDVYHALGKMARKANNMPVYDFQPMFSK